MVLFGRTPCLLVIAIRPDTWITSGPTVSMWSRNCSLVVAVTTGPPAPPVVPFRPSAGTAAKPSGWPAGSANGAPAGTPAAVPIRPTPAPAGTIVGTVAGASTVYG